MLCFLLLLAGAVSANAFGSDVIAKGSVWKYQKGLAEASRPADFWRSPAFDDSAWSSGPAPIYYGEPLTGTILNDMRGSYSSVYMRKTFVISTPAAVDQLQLDFLSDDGCIVWINGQEVARFNMPSGDVPYNGTSSPALAEPIPWSSYVISNASSLLVPGTNVLAVHGFNSSLSSSSDFVFDAELTSSSDLTPPQAVQMLPDNGAAVRSLSTVEVLFSEPVTGVDASDLLVNGVPASDLRVFGPDDYVFSFPEVQAGTVQFAWAADHGIHDLASAGNLFIANSWSCTVDPNAPLPGVMISEFMADNDKTLRDEDGDSSDWIELFNSSEQAIDLGGWHLSNDTNSLARWRFPAISLPPGGYLVVFASEKDRTNAAAKLHTDFKLASGGGFLALSDAATNLVSWFSYPGQREDVSYGRERGNPALTGFFPLPTPGAANSSGGPGFAPKVHFSVEGRTFTQPFDLVLTTDSTNAVIRYAIGKSLPTETSPIYTGPIRVTTSMQVRARAFEPGLLPGDPHSENFVAINPALANFTSDLPVVILHNYGAGGIPATGEQFVMMQIYEPKNGVTSLTNTPDLSQRARFRKRGSSTEGYVKPSLALEVWDEFDADKKVKVAGMPDESDWVFYAPNNFEPVLIHNPFMYELSREIGRYAPRTRFVEVYLNTSGGAIQQANYEGIYVIEEKIKRGPDRVDIDALEPENLKLPEVTGGYMLKIDRPDPGDSSFGAGGQSMNYVDPKGAEIRLAARDPQEQYIVGYFNQFGNALNGANFRDPVNGYAKYIDTPSWIDHHVLNVLAFNVDALRLSTYFYKPRNGKITFGPIWDFDRALGSTDGRDANPKVWFNSGGTDFFGYTWWNRLFQDPDFYQQWIDRYEALRRDQFSISNINRLIDQLAGEVRNAQPREQARWGGSAPPRGGSYQAEVNLMKTYLKNRTDFIDSQLVRPPAFDRAAGPVPAGIAVQLTGPSGATIYYTLDGADPRLSGGAISPKALVYAGPITVNANARIFARSRNPSHALGPVKPSPVWSGYNAATYVVQTPPLAITEIMFHPEPAAGANTNTAQDFEFIEVKNTGGTTLNLAGFAFTSGIDFRFSSGSLAPGARTVVVKNLAAFRSRYGNAIPVAGEFTGSLDNSGERIVLTGPLQEPIADFTYSGSWYPMADGAGFSLVLQNDSVPFSAYGDAGSWRIGVENGTPGSADAAPVQVAPVLVNEAMARPGTGGSDWIELFNPGDAAVSIFGWYLSDELTAPKKFRIPDGASIPAHGYLVFSEAQFDTGPSGFGLSAEGDGAYLFSGNASGELTGYFHGFKFGASAPGRTFGRYLTSDARELFLPLTAPTSGTANARPVYGPVVISEIMYEPPLIGTNDNVLAEYVEIQNVSPQPVPLYDPAHATNTWRLRGGADFDFPAGQGLAPNEAALLVQFEPANTAAASAFRAQYGLSAALQLFGPLQGKLSNTGERLSLQRPDSPGATETPYIVVDELAYASAAPWPAGASGTGASLQRRQGTVADDPASWSAAAPTPGIFTSASADSDHDGLPDDWELAHGLNPNDGTGSSGPDGDPDADGMSNIAEFASGTDPMNAASALRLSAISSAAGVTLTFTAAPDRTYSVYYRDTLNDGWLKLKDLPASGVETATQILEPVNSGSARFYRVVTPAQ